MLTLLMVREHIRNCNVGPWLQNLNIKYAKSRHHQIIIKLDSNFKREETLKIIFLTAECCFFLFTRLQLTSLFINAK